MSLPYSAATAHRRQFTFSPIDYHFQWTTESDGRGWYSWDRMAGKKAAMQARNEAMKAAKLAGRTVKAFSIPDQLVSKGGIGSGNPHVEFVVTVYGFNAE